MQITPITVTRYKLLTNNNGWIERDCLITRTVAHARGGQTSNG